MHGSLELLIVVIMVFAKELDTVNVSLSIFLTFIFSDNLFVEVKTPMKLPVKIVNMCI